MKFPCRLSIKKFKDYLKGALLFSDLSLKLLNAGLDNSWPQVLLRIAKSPSVVKRKWVFLVVGKFPPMLRN